MLTFRTSAFPEVGYLTAHLKSATEAGYQIRIAWHSGGEHSAARVQEKKYSLDRPFRNPRTGVTLRASREEVDKLAGQIGPFIVDSVGQFAAVAEKHGNSSAVPLFASTGLHRDVEKWTDLVRTVLPARARLAREIEVVCERPGHRVDRTHPAQPIRVPMRIACELELSSGLLEAAGYLKDADVQRHLIRIEPWRNRGEPLPEAEILVLSEKISGSGLQLTAEQIRSISPLTRLIIALDRTPASQFRVPAGLRADVALAVIPLVMQVSPERVLHAFLEEIVHDNPLHDAMRKLRERLQDSYVDPSPDQREWASLARVYADPVTNQSLRLSKLVPQVADAAMNVLPASYIGNVESWSQRLGGAMPPDTVGSLVEAFGDLGKAAEPFRAALRQDVNFDGERRGLVPLAMIAGAAARMQERLQRVTPQLVKLLAGKGVVEALEKIQTRRLDAQLFRRVEHGAVVPMHSSERLNPGMPVRLRVHIGQRDDFSLLVAEPPAIDPLLPPLPDEEFHDLQITVFPKDFRLESRATQTVRLSRLGGTAPVEWDLKAPEIFKEPPEDFPAHDPVDSTNGIGWIVGSRAGLRINVYFRNQLLQSFKLIASVGGQDFMQQQQGISVECDYSQTARFGQMDQFGPRLVSLAVNADDETHTLMASRDGEKASLRWDTGQLANFTEAIREKLYEAMTTNGVSLFEFDEVTLELSPGSTASFETSARALAQAGSNLYAKLFQKSRLSSGLRKVLSQVRDSVAGTVQITATDPDYAFPWPILYDFDVPADETKPICKGILTDGSICNCHNSAITYCLRGFWGLRFVVEQRCPAPEPLRVPNRISPSPSNPVIGLVAAVSDVFIDNWAAALPSKTQLTVKAFPNTERLLDTFSDEATRPSVVVFVGHHQNAGDDKLPDHQLLSPTNTPILRLSDFSARGVVDWKLPRSVVFLLACSAGTTRADTGPSLAAALLLHGAAGVIATECTVFTPMVARISRDILAALAASDGGTGKTTIGQAMQRTLFELAREGCPLGLAFTYHGIAEACLP
jgi:hypothetical protein